MAKKVPGKNGGIINKFEKGESGNPNGRPKGTKSKKVLLKKLLKDLVNITNEITDREKLLVYQLYQIVQGDINNGKNISSSVNHLYFIESEFGIKIGISKKPNNRLKQVQQYAASSRLLKVIEFAGKFEKDIHRKFESINIKSNPIIGIEWFMKTDDIYAFIDEIENINDLHRYFNAKGNGQLILF